MDRTLLQLLPLSCFLSFFLSFPFCIKRALKLLTTPWKAQDIPATIHIAWIATSLFPFPWEPMCVSSFKSLTSVAIIGTAGK